MTIQQTFASGEQNVFPLAPGPKCSCEAQLSESTKFTSEITNADYEDWQEEGKVMKKPVGRMPKPAAAPAMPKPAAAMRKPAGSWREDAEADDKEEAENSWRRTRPRPSWRLSLRRPRMR